MNDEAEPGPKNYEDLSEDEKLAAFDAIKKALAKSASSRELPSIKQIVRLAKRAVSSAVNLDTKFRRLSYAINRIEYLKLITRAEFDKRLTAKAIDDPEVFYEYLDEADHAIIQLSLQVEKLGISAAENKASPPTARSKPEGKSSGITGSVPKAEAAPIADGYLDKKEAAAFLRISLRTLGYRMKEPGFPIHRHNGRRPLFKKSELETWASKTSRSSKAP